ncbi:signal peptidase I [Alicyclobacillus sp. SO9]|uniref:signal peptidase I n=1 Tax=Alicyclobacillus sp. SO9 TaxID=2665646 RepID=UPI0018E7C035|nr:signal peptidase I [Alicyclobacillus sp. SO9]QQE79138.1 signal peptidase I [Alicyclobacillus sp. SO9]
MAVKSFMKNWILPIAAGVLVALIVKTWVVSAAVVPSSSMRPTIPNPCYILVDKLSTEFGSLHRGEVVTFHFPDNPSEIFVKRIVGMPGDTVTVKDHSVLVNGKPYKVPTSIIMPNGLGLGTYHVPPGHYFMMGDNRPISRDSRFWTHKYVARSAITGQASFVIFPFNKIKSISQ